jgi:hypothetical protein
MATITVLCYVLGCRERITRSAIHRTYGRVGCCEGHDPSRHGYARPFATPTPVGVVVQPPQAAPRPGTTKVPRTPARPRPLSPVGARAIPSTATTATPF